MSYQKERDEFIAQASREGLDLKTCRKLLRYATTLQRLAEAQCNGDWPYNGDRDRPSALDTPCTACGGSGYIQHGHADNRPMLTAKCNICHGNGKTWHTKAAERHDKRYTTCPKCEASGVAKTAMRRTFGSADSPCHCDGTIADPAIEDCPRHGGKVCPDCRTQELVQSCLVEWYQHYCQNTKVSLNRLTIKPIFQGDPRGAVLRLATPNHPWSEDGRKGYGLYVPARSR